MTKEKKVLGFFVEDAISSTDYCLDTRNGKIFYAGGIFGKEVVRQNKHYLKSLVYIMIENSKAFPAISKADHDRILQEAEEKIRKVFADRISEYRKELKTYPDGKMPRIEYAIWKLQKMKKELGV